MSLKFRKGGAAGNQNILSVIHTVLHACFNKRGVFFFNVKVTLV